MTPCPLDPNSKALSPTFGLRILFGAAMTMKSPSCVQIPKEDYMLIWARFTFKLRDHIGLSASSAIQVLKDVYGINRRILVLVDELSKASNIFKNADENMITEIGLVLDGFQNVDVIISSLSPQYVRALLTGSQRPINYILLGSSLDRRLGQKECQKWVDKILHKVCESDQYVDEFAIRFLKSIDLLMSGHPRSLECLVYQFQNSNIDKSWRNLVLALNESSSHNIVSLPVVMEAVMKDLMSVNSAVHQVIEPQFSSDHNFAHQILKEVLQFQVSNSENFRFLVENGSLLLLPESKFTVEYRPTISLLAFLKLIQNIEDRDKIDPAVSASIILFQGLLKESTLTIGQLYERAVALTIVCYSHASESISLSVSSLFGCTHKIVRNIQYSTIPKLSVRVAISIDDFIIPQGGPQTNELVVAFERCPGFDSVVTLKETKYSPTCTFYLEQRVASVKNENEMRVSKIMNILQFHYWRTYQLTRGAQLTSFSNLYVFFYEASYDSEDVYILKEDLVAAVSTYFKEWESRRIEAPINDDFFEYIPIKNLASDLDQCQRSCFNAFISAGIIGEPDYLQACIIGKDALAEWLVPPVSPIPLLVTMIDKEDKE